MDGRGRKRKIDEVKNLEPSGLNFVKYSVLVSDLRDHVLSYCYSATLFNYSQCSHYCNSEVKKFNTKAPTILLITECDDGSILVEVSYSKDYKTAAPDYFEKTFLLSTFKETMENVQQYLFSLHRYVKNGKIGKLSISLQKWPTKFMQNRGMTEIGDMTVYIQNSMLDDFVEFGRTSNVRVQNLTLDGKNGQEIIRKDDAKQIFNSAFFQQLSKWEISLECEIDDDDFLGFKNPKIELWMKNCMISDNAIREKVAQMNSRYGNFEIVIDVSHESTRVFDLYVIFPDVNSGRFNPPSTVLFLGGVAIIMPKTTKGKYLTLRKFETVNNDIDEEQ